MKFYLRNILIAVGIFSALSWQAFANFEEAGSGPLSKEIRTILAQSEQVALYKVHLASMTEYELAPEASKTLSMDEIEGIRRTLLDKQTYAVDMVRKMRFLPDHAYRFTSGGQTVTAYVSNASRKVAFHVGQEKGNPLDFRLGFQVEKHL